MRDVTRTQPNQYDSIRLRDGERHYNFLINRLGSHITLYIPDNNPNIYHDHCTYRIKVDHIFMDKLHPYKDVRFNLSECEAITPFRFEGDTYHSAYRVCDDFDITKYVNADIFVSMEMVERNRTGEWIHDIRFDTAYSSYIHYDVPFVKEAWGRSTDIWVRIGDTIEVEPSLHYNPIIYSTTTGQQLYDFRTRCTIMLATDEDVLYEKTQGDHREIYVFDIDFPPIYRDDLRMVVLVDYMLDGYKHLTLRHIVPISKDMMQVMKSNKINVPDMNIYEPKILNIETPKTPDYNVQTKHIIKPMFFRTHPTASIVLYAGVNDNIAINLDKYKNYVKYFSIKIGTTIFKEIGRTDKGVIFKILGTMLTKEEGVYHILNENGDRITSGNYSIL